MKDIHRRLTSIALPAAEPYGFVLAGGYAISEHGIGDRPSSDVDLFGLLDNAASFPEAVDHVRTALREAGLQVTDNRVGATFADLRVTDPMSGEWSDMQMGVNYRAYPPARLDIGPVLDIRDAVAGKMSALWSRGEVRDYIDIDAVVQSGTFTRDEILAIGDSQEFQPMDRRMLADRFAMAEQYSPAQYWRYDINAEQRQQIIARFREWADSIDPRLPSSSPPAVLRAVATQPITKIRSSSPSPQAVPYKPPTSVRGSGLSR